MSLLVPDRLTGCHMNPGVKFMYKNFAKNQGSILGDVMGLGKTIQVGIDA